MHLPFLPTVAQTEEHSDLPEVVAIQDLSGRAIAAAAREIAEEQEEAATWPTATA